MKHYEVIVVGGGATGASALYHLAKMGVTNTLLVEKKEGYGRGATGSWGSLVRVFHAGLKITQRASKSVPFFLEFEERTQQPSGFNKLGSLYFIKKPQLNDFKEHIFALEGSGLEYHLIEPREGKKRFPDYVWYEDDLAIYEPNAGVACPWATTEGFIKYAQAKGAEALLNTKLSHIERQGDAIKGIETEGGERFSCDLLVLTTGIWTENLVNSIGSKVDIYPEVIQLNRFCRQHEVKQHPLFIDLSSRSFGHSSFNGSFVGGYIPPEPKIPKRSRAIQHVSLHHANVAKHKLATRLPWIKSATLECGIRAIDSYTHNKTGLIEFDLRYPNLLVSAGWSCGGFTTAPDNGRNIAEMLVARG